VPLMGIDTTSARFLMLCAHSGVDFSRTLMLGRQEIHSNPQRLSLAAAECGFPLGDQTVIDMMRERPAYAEPLFHALGAVTVDSMDAADYEDATILHDLNDPIGDELKGRFTAVFDGGTLEHVFQFPTALKNAMEMLEVGGTLMTITTANNLLGHGFYQFSPELFFRAFSAENGFVTEGCYLYENSGLGDLNGEVRSVKDPLEMKRRVTLRNSDETLIVVRALKVAERLVFARTPQQSDYEAAWQTPSQGSAPRKLKISANKALRLRLREVAWPLKQWVRSVQYGVRNDRYDPQAYRKVRFAAGLLPEMKQAHEAASTRLSPNQALVQTPIWE